MPSIREAAEELSRTDDILEDLDEKFSGIDSIETDATVKEGFLSKKIEGKRPGTVAGIDGGLLKKRYSSGDVVAVRAIAAVFDFTGGLEASYIPGKNPEPEFHVFAAEEKDSMDRNAETLRLREEVAVAREAAGKAETVYMDGSIVPSYSGSSEVIGSYEKLYRDAGYGNLAGVVEDSYGLKLSSLLKEKLGFEVPEIRDTRLMDAILEEGERSFVRRYSSSPVEHPVLQEFEDETVNRLHTFYVKLSSRDLPLRIDFLGDREHADRIAGELMAMRSSASYTLPSPVVEADKRAKIPREYMKRLEKRFSPGLKRRERRRF